MMNGLSRLKVEGFKSIRNMDLELRPLNILIGANGSGKSNFISLFRLIKSLSEGRFQMYSAINGKAETLMYYGRKNTYKIIITLLLGDNIIDIELIPTIDNNFVLSERLLSSVKAHVGDIFDLRSGKSIDLIGGITGGLTQKSGDKESILSLIQKDDPLYPELNPLLNLAYYHFHDTGESSGIKAHCNIKDNSYLRADGSNLAAFLYYLRNNSPDEFRQITEAIRLAAPYFDKFDLKPDRDNPSYITLEWLEKDSDKYFNASMLSDGTLRFICLATALLQPTEKLPPIILIDEPELGLHPFAINLLAEMLTGASQHSQIIVSTQSVTLIDEFLPEDIIVVERHKKESLFKRLSTEELSIWLNDYSIGELWEKNILGGRP